MRTGRIPIYDIKPNEKYHKLTTMEKILVNRRNKWKCKCECGKEVLVHGWRLAKELTTSCGCENNARFHKMITKHGGRYSPEYESYMGMIKRCYNTKYKRYKDYGARGITVCDRWRQSFECFLEDVGPRPDKGYSLERKNNNGNYEPKNVVWATPKEQARNTRRNRKVTIDNVTKNIVEWSEVSGVSQGLIWYRLNAGWCPKEAVYTPPRTKQ